MVIEKSLEMRFEHTAEDGVHSQEIHADGANHHGRSEGEQLEDHIT